jgi:hypothetical protein
VLAGPDLIHPPRADLADRWLRGALRPSACYAASKIIMVVP